MSDKKLNFLLNWLDNKVEHQVKMKNGRRRFLYKCTTCGRCRNKIAIMIDKENLKKESFEFHPTLLRFAKVDPATMSDQYKMQDQVTYIDSALKDHVTCNNPKGCLASTAMFWLNFLSSFEE